MNAVAVVVCLLASFVLGAASADANDQYNGLAGALVFALAVAVGWVGVAQL